MDKPHIQVIAGTTRASRVGRKVADWVMALSETRDDMTFELIDLAETGLPLYNELRAPKSRHYEHVTTKKWSETVSRADGYILVTGEYNHGIPPSLKNALDYLYYEWNHKPAAFVGYGGMGGTRAIEHLVGVASELMMVPTRERLHIIDVWDALDKNGIPKPELVRGDADAFFDELAWWAFATKAARERSLVAA